MIGDAISNFEAGNFKEAEALCREILDHAPENVDAMHILGLSLFESGAFEDGEAWLRKVVSLQPQQPNAYFSLGNMLHARGRLREAQNCFEKVIGLEPDHAGANYNLANLLLSEKDFRNAVAYYEQTLQLNPELAPAWHNKGVALVALGRKSEAMECYERAVTFSHDGSLSFNSMGMLLKGTGDLIGAREYFQKAVNIRPTYVSAWINLGNVYLEMSDTDSAGHALGEALKLSPNLPEVHFNLANLNHEQGNAAEALAGYGKALQLKSDYPAAVAQLYYQAQQVCDWPLAERWEAKLDTDTGSCLEQGRRPAEMPFVNLTRQMDPVRNLAVAKAWSCEVGKRVPREGISFTHGSKVRCSGRITLGYLSGDFRDHPVGLLVSQMLACHDRERFQVYGYAYGPDDSGNARKKIARGCDRFTDVGKLSTTAAAKQVFDDGVDILVDLTGHTRNNRFGICALRPAPVQVSYLGFLGSSGADFIDYIFTDRIVTPPDQADAYSEKFVYLPNTFMVTDNRQKISEQSYERRDFGLPENSFVFCSFNNPYKIDPAVFECWMRILEKIPRSVLWLFAKNSLTAENLKREAAGRHVSPERLVFADKMPLEAHLARLKMADLALDTWRYNGGATTVNALWAGVPVITLEGKHFVSRMTASCLSAAGLPELITDSSVAYESLSVRLAANPNELKGLKGRLLKKRIDSPLFDTARFASSMERAYEKMWGVYLAGKKPEAIEI